MCRFSFIKVWLICAAVHPFTVRICALPLRERLSGNYENATLMDITTGQIDPCRASSSVTSYEEVDGDRECICTDEYNPVCGRDGNTYTNPCRLCCAGTKLDYFGPCKEKGCRCPLIYVPVRGEDGKTYGNKCFAKCANVTIRYNGACQKGIKCGEGIKPVTCTRDPCDGLDTCPSYPDAICFSNYCPGITQFHGSYVSGPCTAIYVDPRNQKLVDCCKK